MGKAKDIPVAYQEDPELAIARLGGGDDKYS
jgi:hypothetical protein